LPITTGAAGNAESSTVLNFTSSLLDYADDDDDDEDEEAAPDDGEFCRIFESSGSPVADQLLDLQQQQPTVVTKKRRTDAVASVVVAETNIVSGNLTKTKRRSNASSNNSSKNESSMFPKIAPFLTGRNCSSQHGPKFRHY
jgi:hypothetical protein